MGTLTGSTLILSDHCRHKLPTSCRLTATALCCACQDKRPHSTTYSTYVDGIGLVMRGTRWQRYCYFCKEFWRNRVAATDPPLEPSQTRIPEYPDQALFLDQWFEYHRGYRLEKREDGTETKLPLTCEIPWADTDPGTLPVLNDSQRLMTTRVVHRNAAPTEDVSLESTLDELLMEANENDDDAGVRGNTADLVRPIPEAEIIAQREANRAAIVTAAQQAQDRLNETQTRLDDAQSRRDRAASELHSTELAMRASIEEQRRAFRDYRQAQDQLRTIDSNENAQRRAMQRFVRVFGTREDIEQQGSDYVSPLTSMFTRAYERYNVAEEVRAEERASVENTARFQNSVEFLVESTRTTNLRAPRIGNAEEQPMMTLDDDRPPPSTDAEMTIILACKICLQQKADTVCMPCGHLVMCSFCADVWLPTGERDRTQPLGKPSCPSCRKAVKKRMKIYLA